MPGEPGSRRKADPEGVLREYFRQELGKAEASLPCPPPLPALPAVMATPAMLPVKARKAVADQSLFTVKADHSGYGFRGNLASLLLATCVLGFAALALSCSPRTALARSIGHVVAGQGLEILKQETIDVAGLVWQQGQEYFRQKHSGSITAVGTPAAEKENL